MGRVWNLYTISSGARFKPPTQEGARQHLPAAFIHIQRRERGRVLVSGPASFDGRGLCSPCRLHHAMNPEISAKG